jgi:CheY-like chemotaxis protein
MSDKAADARLNLSKATVLLLQNNQTELDILGQVFIGFGVKAIRKCLTIGQADQAIQTVNFDLLVVDCEMPGGAGYDFVAKVRRLESSDNRLAPTMLLSGHTVPSSISKARDCGANFVVAKPITPKIMFDRVIWLAREEREFVVTDSYAGPCRRHKTFGPPAGMKGRRREDVSAKLGKADGPDMSQSDIDAMLNPKRASV